MGQGGERPWIGWVRSLQKNEAVPDGTAPYAEREGFEPPVPLRAQQFSRLPQSTTLPPLLLVLL